MCTTYKLLNNVIFLKHDLIVLSFYFIVALVSCTVISGVRFEAVFHFLIFLFNHKSKQTTNKPQQIRVISGTKPWMAHARVCFLGMAGFMYLTFLKFRNYILLC